MRLINDEEVLKNAKESTFTFAEDRRRYMDFLEYCLNNAPTVEAKEVVYGEWKNRSEYNDHLHCECSICGFTTENYRVIKTFGISSDDYIEVKWVYCPKCGASMRTSAE